MRKILSKTSMAKRDTRVNWSDTGRGGFAAQGPLMSGATDYVFLHGPTLMDMDNTTGVSNSRQNQNQRTNATCYIRGFKENIHWETNDGTAWKWRRVVFMMKGTYYLLNPGSALSGSVDAQPYAYAEVNGLGFTRLWRNLAQTATQQNRTFVEALLFKGSQGYDWTDQFTAAIDTDRVTLMYDKTRTVQSGNTSGIIRKYQMWHGVNANLRYADDEIGSSEQGGVAFASVYASPKNYGIGDMLIYDFIRSNESATTSSQLVMSSTSTLYWHEK